MNVSRVYTDKEYFKLLALRLAGNMPALQAKTAELHQKYYSSKREEANNGR